MVGAVPGAELPCCVWAEAIRQCWPGAGTQAVVLRIQPRSTSAAESVHFSPMPLPCIRMSVQWNGISDVSFIVLFCSSVRWKISKSVWKTSVFMCYLWARFKNPRFYMCEVFFSPRSGLENQIPRSPNRNSA